MSLIAKIAFALVAAWATLVVLIYTFQDRLVFYPRRLVASALAEIRRQYPHAQEIELPTADGERLHGWFLPGASPQAPLIIYFGGNAEEVSWQLARAADYPGHALLLMNYRGYGASSGRPQQEALCADALQVYDAFARRADIDASRIVLVGRSLGSGVAIHVAARRKVAGVVLLTPYDSLRAVAAHHYPLLPVGMLLRHPFDAMTEIKNVHIPALILAAGHDTVVPKNHARALYEAWRGRKIWHELSSADHNSIDAHPQYVSAIQSFLRTLDQR